MEDFEIAERTTERVRKGFVYVGYGLMGVGVLVFLVMFFGAKERIERTLEWEMTDCVVERAMPFNDIRRGNEIETRYYMSVKYAYEFGGEEYTSRRYSMAGNTVYLGSIPDLDKERDKKMGRIIEACEKIYPVGSKAVCFVDPDEPSEAILRHVNGGYVETFKYLREQMWGLVVCGGIFFLGVGARGCGRMLG